ncbi:hypothetical protein [Streptomyces sp. NPDC127084]|uniref:hypothetical protein n=1 Tax=Streptomyces sp. NPDC127084 TaxID=3347133 RepID=UPI0036596D1D
MVLGVTPDGAPAFAMSYEISGQVENTEIRPADDYLGRLRAGRLLEGRPGFHRWPVLDVKVVNNTAEAVLLHEAVLQVRSSKPDLRAVPILLYKDLNIFLRNDGWGQMEDCTLTFSLFATPGTTARRFGGPFVLRSTDLVEGRGRAGRRRAHWPVADALRSCGADPAAVSSLAGPARHSARSRALLDAALGPFAERGEAFVLGRLEYTHPGPDGALVRAANLVRGRLDLTDDGSPRIGGYLPPAHQYSTVLPSTRSDYRVAVPLSQFVQSGEADRFLVTIASDRSAIHDFSLTVRYNEQQEVVAAERVRLELFLPRPMEDKAPSRLQLGPAAARPARRWWWQGLRRSGPSS